MIRKEVEDPIAEMIVSGETHVRNPDWMQMADSVLVQPAGKKRLQMAVDNGKSSGKMLDISASENSII